MSPVAFITIHSGDSRTRSALPAGICVLGRDPECDVVVESDGVSRRHARLVLGEEDFQIEDLGSTSGTQAGGKLVTASLRLPYPQAILLGPVKVRIEAVPATASETMDADESPTIIKPARPAKPVTTGVADSSADRYAVGAEIARGGMGAILKSQDLKLGRDVAMKVMLEHGKRSVDARMRFVQEAEIMARLEHPNIVPVHDLGADAQGRPFYTMKEVHGRTLQDILNGIRKEDKATVAKYSLQDLLTIFLKVCDGVSFAHSRGVVHRDLKPENIMIGEYGEVLVMDWGLAKDMQAKFSSGLLAKEEATPASFAGASSSASGSGLTMDGSVMGTPQYMPPEQAEGKLGEIDERSDVFSLGGILYAILTLRAPVQGRSLAEVLENVKAGNITPPSSYNAPSSGLGKQKLAEGEVTEAKKITPLPHCPGGRVPGPLSAVAMKALSARRDDRYQSVTLLASDIEKYLGGFSTTAENVGRAGELWLLIKRHRTFTASLAVIAVLTAGFMAKVISSERKATANALEATANAAKAETSAALAKEAETIAVEKAQEARRALAKSALSLAEASLREADGPAMQAALNDVPDDLRDSTWSYLLAQSDSSFARIRTGATPSEGVAADPTRPGVFAIADRDRKVTIMNVRTGERLMEFQPGFTQKNNANRYRLAFSPDGQRLAIGRDGPGGIVIHRTLDGKKEREWATPANSHVEFGDNEKLLRHGGNTLQVWNSITATLLWEHKAIDNIGVVGNFIPGGSEVLKMTAKNRLQVVSASDGALVRNLGGRTPQYTWFMAVHPDGGSAVTHTATQFTECVSLTDGKVLYTLPQRQVRHWMGFTANGDQLVTLAAQNDGGQLIEAWNARTGSAIRSLLGGQGAAVVLSVHPRSNELLVSGANARAWDLTGPLPGWHLPSYHMGTAAFWGSDDLLLSTAFGPNPWGLRRLTRTGTELIWQPKEKVNYTAAISANGEVAVLSRPGFSKDALLLRKSGDTVEQFGELKAGFWPYRLRPSPNGKMLVAMERVTAPYAEVLDTGTGKYVFIIPEPKRFSDMGWLGNDRLVGLLTLGAARGDAGSEECIRVWDVTTGSVLQTVTNRTAMDVLAVAPDGKRFAEAGADKLIRIRDAATLQVQSVFRAHDAPITVMAWHPTKPMIATGSEDLSIKVLDFEKGRFVHEFRGLLNPPDYISFSTTGKRLAAKTSHDYQIYIWELEAEVATSKRSPTSNSTSNTEGWEDLLGQLKPANVTPANTGWRMDNGVLFSSGTPKLILPLPGDFSAASYQLRVRLRRLIPKDFFYLALPVGDRKVGFVLDGTPQVGFCTALSQVDGKYGLASPGAVQGLQVRDSEQHDLEVTVRLDGANATITATLDSQPLYSWTGPITSLSQFPGSAPTPPGALAIRASQPDWVVYEVKVKRLDAKTVF
jgi:serine/threonine protein kinase/WD40 repeat protein